MTITSDDGVTRVLAFSWQSAIDKWSDLTIISTVLSIFAASHLDAFALSLLFFLFLENFLLSHPTAGFNAA